MTAPELTGPRDTGEVLPAGPRPLGAGTVTVAGMTLALLTTVCGVVGVREALVRAGLLGGRPCLGDALEALDGLRPQWWGVPVGAALALAGLGLFRATVRRRPRTTLPVASSTGVEIARRAVGRLAVHAAEDVDGVLSARARVRRRGIDVSAQVTGDPAAIEDEVRRCVEARLVSLRPSPTVRVSARTLVRR